MNFRLPSEGLKVRRSEIPEVRKRRYPGGDPDEVGQDYPSLRRALGEMVQLIEAAIAP
jgi:hypothetical protein